MARTALMMLVLTAVIVSGGCASRTRPDAGNSALRRFTYDIPALGTRFRVIFYAADAPAAGSASAAVAARLADLESKLSPDRPQGELRRLCDGAGGPPRKVSDDLFAVLDIGQRISRASGGAFDVTAGPHLQMRRRAAESGAEPGEAQLEAARSLVGGDKLHVEPIERMVSLAAPGMRLEPAGVANGFAADALVEELKRRGIVRSLVDATASGAAGRTVVVGGPPPGKTGWDVRVDGLAPPPAARRRGKAAKPVLLTLRNAAVAFSPNAPAALGRSPGWLIDPLTGRPATERPWVIVIDRHGASAAGLATAAAVLGRESGASLVRSWGAVAHFESSAAAAPPPPR